MTDLQCTVFNRLLDTLFCPEYFACDLKHGTYHTTRGRVFPWTRKGFECITQYVHVNSAKRLTDAKTWYRLYFVFWVILAHATLYVVEYIIKRSQYNEILLYDKS